jgi:acylaminoacyl-peptidase
VKGLVDEKKIYLFGGSYGGYLSSLMIAKYPRRFRGSVIRNPVLDLMYMLSSTDIPDWIHSECLG